VVISTNDLQYGNEVKKIDVVFGDDANTTVESFQMKSEGARSMALRILVCTILGLAGALPALALHLPLLWIVIFAVFGAAWGGVLAALGGYVLQPLAIIGLILDVTWSLLNTLTGLVWLLVCLIRGTLGDQTANGQRSGTLVVAGAALPGASATTIGNIIGGDWLAHEEVHVWQARIFGPLYWLIYLCSYAANMLARFMTLRFNDPHWEAYGRVVMEDWAEWSCPAGGPNGNNGKIYWGWWLLMLVMAALNALFILAIVVSLPPLHATGPWSHLPVPAWLIGVLGLLAYALVRSAIHRNDDHSADTPDLAPSAGVS
jgi:hypothetical protein